MPLRVSIARTPSASVANRSTTTESLLLAASPRLKKAVSRGARPSCRALSSSISDLLAQNAMLPTQIRQVGSAQAACGAGGAAQEACGAGKSCVIQTIYDQSPMQNHLTRAPCLLAFTSRSQCPRRAEGEAVVRMLASPEHTQLLAGA